MSAPIDFGAAALAVEDALRNLAAVDVHLWRTPWYSGSDGTEKRVSIHLRLDGGGQTVEVAGIDLAEAIAAALAFRAAEKAAQP